MATDPAEEARGSNDPPSDDDDDDREEIRSIVREEVHSILDGLTDLGGGGGGDGGSGSGGEPDPEPVTLRAIEEAMRSKVDEAMGPLREDIAKLKGPSKRAAASKPKAEPETPPEEPARKKVWERLWS